MLAIVIALVVSLGITMLSLQTKYDFTSCFHYMLMVTLILSFVTSGVILVIVCLLNDEILIAFYAALGAILFILCVTINVQMLISGNRKIKLTTNDYVYTCLQLYLDLFYFIFFNCENKEY
jgi:protein lifeguard